MRPNVRTIRRKRARRHRVLAVTAIGGLAALITGTAVAQTLGESSQPLPLIGGIAPIGPSTPAKSVVTPGSTPDTTTPSTTTPSTTTPTTTPANTAADTTPPADQATVTPPTNPEELNGLGPAIAELVQQLVGQALSQAQQPGQ